MFILWIDIEKVGHGSGYRNILKEQLKTILIIDFMLPKWMKDIKSIYFVLSFTL